MSSAPLAPDTERTVLTDGGYEVLYVDIGRWLSDREPLTTTDLLLTLVLALLPDGSPNNATGRLAEFARRAQDPNTNYPKWDGTPMRLGESLDWMLMAHTPPQPPRAKNSADATHT